MGQDPGTFLKNKHLLAMLRHVARRTDRGKPCLDQCCWSPREIIFIRCWLSTPIFLPEKPHGQRSLVGSLCPWDHKKSNVTERLSMCTHTHPCHTLFKDVAYICNHSNILMIWVLSPPSSCLICRQQSSGTESLITFSKVNQLLVEMGLTLQHSDFGTHGFQTGSSPNDFECQDCMKPGVKGPSVTVQKDWTLGMTRRNSPMDS